MKRVRGHGRILRAATWRRGSRELAAGWERLRTSGSLTGEPERGGHGGRGWILRWSQGSGERRSHRRAGLEDGGEGKSMGEVGNGDRGGLVWGRSQFLCMKGERWI